MVVHEAETVRGAKRAIAIPGSGVLRLDGWGRLGGEMEADGRTYALAHQGFLRHQRFTARDVVTREAIYARDGREVRAPGASFEWLVTPGIRMTASLRRHGVEVARFEPHGSWRHLVTAEVDEDAGLSDGLVVFGCYLALRDQQDVNASVLGGTAAADALSRRN